VGVEFLPRRSAQFYLTHQRGVDRLALGHVGGVLMDGLTPRQQRVTKFIQREFRRNGEAPTYREIARHIGRDVRTAYQHVEALERKGILERRGGRIELLGDYRPPRGIPLVGHVAAGTPILATENVEDHLDIEKLLKGQATDDLFLLRVKGDSMIDAGINDGDLVLVRSQPKVNNGEIAAVIIGDEATVKYVRISDDEVILEPANSKYKPITLGPEDDVRIAGKVVMALRQF
jgi:repressor LexA